MKNLVHQVFAQDQAIAVAGLCPLLVIATSFVSGFAMGVVFLLALTLTCAAVSAARRLITQEMRFPVILLLSATVVTVIYFGLQAYFYELSLALGIYVPLIAVNCLLLFQADARAMNSPVAASLAAGLKAGLAVLAVLISVGALREILGAGTLLRDIGFLLGEDAGTGHLALFDGESGLTVFKSAAGTFLVLGLFLALAKLVAEKGNSPRTAEVETANR